MAGPALWRRADRRHLEVDIHDLGVGRPAVHALVERIPRVAAQDGPVRHPLRDDMEPPRQRFRGCAGPGSAAARRHKKRSEVLSGRG